MHGRGWTGTLIAGALAAAAAALPVRALPIDLIAGGIGPFDCLAPQGVTIPGGFPAFAPLCRDTSQSLLNGPFGVNGDPPATGPTGIAGLTFAQPAGVVNPLFAAPLLSAARGFLGDELTRELFERPRSALHLQEAFAGDEPGNTSCTGNPSSDPKGCSTTFTTAQDELFMGQGYGAVRLLQAAATADRAPQLDGDPGQPRHERWFPLQFDSHGDVLGRTQQVFTDPTHPDRVYRVAKNYDKTVGSRVVTVLKGSLTLDPTTPDGTPNDPMRSLGRELTASDLLTPGQSATLESEFGPTGLLLEARLGPDRLDLILSPDFPHGPTHARFSASSTFLAHNLGTSVGVRRISADGFCNATNVFNLHGVPYCGITGQKPIGFPDDIQFGNQLIAGPLGPDGIEFT
ncbi:MAG: hypothetical protein HRU00_07850, partial [Myxococcales bacterium]|nr:hypothetical protein [Myxococcales bacterium]